MYYVHLEEQLLIIVINDCKFTQNTFNTNAPPTHTQNNHTSWVNAPVETFMTK